MTMTPAAKNVPLSSPFDLTGDSTLALAFVTVALAIAAFVQAHLSRKAIDASVLQEKANFAAERVRQAEAVTPILVADAHSLNDFFWLQFKNVGPGAAVNVRFSGILDGREFSAAEYSVPAVAAAGGSTLTDVRLSGFAENRERIAEFLIRYEDIFGNVYSTEYITFDELSENYVWRRPWFGEALGIDRPRDCSDDPPSWGLRPRRFFDAPRGLY